MNRHNIDSHAEGAFGKQARTVLSGTTPRTRTRGRVIRLGSVALAIAAAIAASGCGKHTIDQGSGTGGGDQAVNRTGSESAVLASAPAPLGTPDTTAGATEAPAAGHPDALPPEVEAAVVDSVVTPGSVVEISALASEDVVDMGLSDGRGKEQPFAYDSTMSVWRVLYRVPIRSASDRLGLAVTATNSAGHWRRVWVFLDLQK